MLVGIDFPKEYLIKGRQAQSVGRNARIGFRQLGSRPASIGGIAFGGSALRNIRSGRKQLPIHTIAAVQTI
ncbi:MAG: hypothetical protein V4673_06235 [Pseudomonadota bacterium]